MIKLDWISIIIIHKVIWIMFFIDFYLVITVGVLVYYFFKLINKFLMFDDNKVCALLISTEGAFYVVVNGFLIIVYLFLIFSI